MKIKIDENLPADLAMPLTELGHDVETVLGEGLGGRDDDTVSAAAQGESRFLITQDMGLADLRRMIGGKNPGVLLVRLRDPSRSALIQRVGWLFEHESVESWKGALVVATDRKVRVRHH